MNSKERFHSICRREIPDRFPIDYLAHPETDRKLLAYYRLHNMDELHERLGTDFYYLSYRDISQNESCLPHYHGPQLEMNADERICPFGIRWKRGAYDARFAVDESLEGPLENAQSEQDVLDHPWPRPEWFDLDMFHRECEIYQNKVIVGGFWSGILGDSFRMHGFENFLFNMMQNPTLIKTLVNRMTDFYLEMNDRLFAELKGKLDVWFFGNDLGSQNGLLFSKPMFEDFFADNIRRLTTLAHNYDIKVMMHSCGAISELIPHLIELGVDILDPIQISACNMKPEELAAQCENRIIFHGGVDTQHILPNAAPEEVARHTRQIIQDLGRHHRYIVAPSQILQSDIPPENIHAMYQAARESYPNQR